MECAPSPCFCSESPRFAQQVRQTDWTVPISFPPSLTDTQYCMSSCPVAGSFRHSAGLRLLRPHSVCARPWLLNFMTSPGGKRPKRTGQSIKIDLLCLSDETRRPNLRSFHLFSAPHLKSKGDPLSDKERQGFPASLKMTDPKISLIKRLTDCERNSRLNLTQ